MNEKYAQIALVDKIKRMKKLSQIVVDPTTWFPYKKIKKKKKSFSRCLRLQGKEPLKNLQVSLYGFNQP